VFDVHVDTTGQPVITARAEEDSPIPAGRVPEATWGKIIPEIRTRATLVNTAPLSLTGLYPQAFLTVNQPTFLGVPSVAVGRHQQMAGHHETALDAFANPRLTPQQVEQAFPQARFTDTTVHGLTRHLSSRPNGIQGFLKVNTSWYNVATRHGQTLLYSTDYGDPGEPIPSSRLAGQDMQFLDVGAARAVLAPRTQRRLTDFPVYEWRAIGFDDAVDQTAQIGPGEEVHIGGTLTRRTNDAPAGTGISWTLEHQGDNGTFKGELRVGGKFTGKSIPRDQVTPEIRSYPLGSVFIRYLKKRDTDGTLRGYGGRPVS
jgi:hypothetical protein